MTMLRVAMAQFDFPVGAVDANQERIVAMIGHARDVLEADVVLFPELAVCGYPPDDLLLRPAFLQRCDEALKAIANAAHGVVAVVGHPEHDGSQLFNAASVFADGLCQQTYRKRELPNYAVFDERRYFQPGAGVCTFELKGAILGLVICEDLWHDAPLRDTVAAGAQAVLVPNASPFEKNQPAQRDGLLSRAVQQHHVPLAYLNTVGGQDDVVFDGGSVLADACGHIHDSALAFEETWLLADLDVEHGRWQARQWPAETDESAESLVYRALVCATRDYARKNGFAQVWVGSSGGLDSALVIAIACDALGADAVHAVRMPSRYTSDISNDLAEIQAKHLGVTLHSVSIKAPFEGFLTALEAEFEGEPANIAEENLQARTRGALLMALSNKFGGLVLTTGNKSEMAVGYATLYGDMCGGFAPLKDVYKTMAYRLARWRNNHALPAWAQGEVIPAGIIERAPTAELRENQLDRDSLPDYAELDAILERFIESEQSADTIIEAGFDAATVRKVLRQVMLSEFKRRQAAPGPRVTHRAFGRERRYPVSSGWL